MSGSALDDALTTALGAEYAAVYGYGAAGPLLPASLSAAVHNAYDGHRRSRDELVGMLRDRGATPSPAPAAYGLQPRPRSSASALALLASLEDDVTAGWAGIVGATGSASLRRTALAAWQDAARRAAQWRLTGGVRPATRPLPGLTR